MYYWELQTNNMSYLKTYQNCFYEWQMAAHEASPFFSQIIQQNDHIYLENPSAADAEMKTNRNACVSDDPQPLRGSMAPDEAAKELVTTTN